MTTPDHEQIEKNVRHTTGVHALRKIRAIVDKDLTEEALRAKLLHKVIWYGGGFSFVLAAWILSRHFGVI